jgi:hypothetical protein
MPGIINSAPDCIVSGSGTEEARIEDSADFVIGNNYGDCAGFMTFGPGATYGPEGEAANTAYMVLTWVGIAFMVFVLVGWILYENRRLITYALARRGGGSVDSAAAAAEESKLA